ncbi:MAG: exonuclease domain-containing protein [Verrucomicrobiales bacterium]|nr:3'-5' exonuclease [Verrucomicrobiota bacterium JB025]
MNFFSRNKPVGQVADYIAATKKPPNPKTPIGDCKLVALDCETTGFNIGVDVILSAALLPIEGHSLPISKLQDWLVQQPDHRPNQATTIHGIMPQESKLGVSEEQLVQAMEPTLRGAVLVGHHAGFDAAVINVLFKRHFKTRIRNYFIDTADLAMVEMDAFKKTGYANQRPPSLDEVCAQLDLPMIGRHTAAGDTFTTAELFLLLCGRRKRRLGRELVLKDFHLSKL